MISGVRIHNIRGKKKVTLPSLLLFLPADVWSNGRLSPIVLDQGLLKAENVLTALEQRTDILY